MKNLRLTFLLICITISIGFSQPPADPDPNGNGGGNPTVPISGIELLIGAGCLVGIRRSLGFLKGFRKSS